MCIRLLHEGVLLVQEQLNSMLQKHNQRCCQCSAHFQSLQYIFLESKTELNTIKISTKFQIRLVNQNSYHKSIGKDCLLQRIFQRFLLDCHQTCSHPENKQIVQIKDVNFFILPLNIYL